MNLSGGFTWQIYFHRAVRNGVFFYLVFSALCTCGQHGRLSGPELRWALLHPVAAFKVKKISRQCDSIYKRIEKLSSLRNEFSSGGKKDALRHLFYMAAFAQKIKARKVRSLGKAHEKANYRQFLKSKTEDGEIPDSLASVMDLKNNEIGISLGTESKSLEPGVLVQVALDKVLFGEAYIFKRNKRGDYLDCPGKVINLKEYSGKWFVPKCLVKSNYDYAD